MVLFYIYIYSIKFKSDEELCSALETSYWSISVCVIPNLVHQNTSKIWIMIYFEMQVICDMGL